LNRRNGFAIVPEWFLDDDPSPPATVFLELTRLTQLRGDFHDEFWCDGQGRKVD
jgi:hypothetical protein